MLALVADTSLDQKQKYRAISVLYPLFILFSLCVQHIVTTRVQQWPENPLDSLQEELDHALHPKKQWSKRRRSTSDIPRSAPQVVFRKLVSLMIHQSDSDSEDEQAASPARPSVFLFRAPPKAVAASSVGIILFL